MQGPDELWSWRQEGFLILEERVYVSASIRMAIMERGHDHPLAGYYGRDKTQNMLKSRYFWPSMNADIANYVTSCQVCKRNKPSHQKTPGHLSPLQRQRAPGHGWALILLRTFRSLVIARTMPLW
jgi:hypothetical protein